MVSSAGMGAPIILEKKGAKWAVFLDVAAAYRRAPSRVHKKLAAYPRDGVLPIAKTAGGGLGLVDGGKPALFSKSEAESYAHKIGRYLLDMGDMVYAYTEERRGGGEEPRDARRFARKVQLLRSEGYPQRQAVAIAYRYERGGRR